MTTVQDPSDNLFPLIRHIDQSFWTCCNRYSGLGSPRHNPYKALKEVM